MIIKESGALTEFSRTALLQNSQSSQKHKQTIAVFFVSIIIIIYHYHTN